MNPWVMPQGRARGQNLGHPNKVVYYSFFYTNNILIKMGIGHVYHINIQCNKVKVIVTLFSCSTDFALYFEDYFMD